MLDLISTNENVDKDVCEKEKHSSNQKINKIQNLFTNTLRREIFKTLQVCKRFAVLLLRSWWIK